MAEIDRRGVFVSWSQPAAAEIARHLKPFLEDVLGTATIFMSQAMEAGTRWSMEIPQRLESCNAGLVLVTPENRREPWLHFEAGALSKQIDESRVVPLLCGGASVGDIQGTPLSLFQAANLNHDEFIAICVSFGHAFGTPEDTVRRRFDKSWPELEQEVSNVEVTQGPSKQLGLPDVMAVLERVSSQVTLIETTLRPSGALQPYSSTIAGALGLPRPRSLGDLLADQPATATAEAAKRAVAELLTKYEARNIRSIDLKDPDGDQPKKGGRKRRIASRGANMS
jgi:hypothetical protein